MAIELDFAVAGQTLSRTDGDAVAAGAVGMRAKFTFDSAWDGLDTIIARFAGPTYQHFDATVTAGACTVPWEALAYPMMIVSVAGYAGSTEKVTTQNLVIPVLQSSSSLQVPAPPTPTEYADITQSLDAATAAVNGVGVQAQASATAAAVSETAAASSAAAASNSASAAAGSASMAATDASTATTKASAADASAQSASASASAAASSASAAATSETNAANSATAASSSASDATSNAQLAGTSATDAGNYATAAAASAAASAGSATAAASSLSQLETDIGTTVCSLGTDGKIPTANLPALATTETYVVADAASLLTLSAQRGDFGLILKNGVITDSYVLAGDDPTVADGWIRFGGGYVAQAGHALQADNATDSDKVDGNHLLAMTQAQYDAAVIDANTVYLVG